MLRMRPSCQCRVVLITNTLQSGLQSRILFRLTLHGEDVLLQRRTTPIQPRPFVVSTSRKCTPVAPFAIAVVSASTTPGRDVRQRRTGAAPFVELESRSDRHGRCVAQPMPRRSSHNVGLLMLYQVPDDGGQPSHDRYAGNL